MKMKFSNHFFYTSFNSVLVAQYFVISGLVSIAFSPPLANFFIALSFIAALSISTIRNQLFDFFNTKLGYACIAFIVILTSGLIYGIESNNVIASSIWGWRKFLMLPIAAAIFMNDTQAKQKLIDTFWFICVLLTIYSFVHFYAPILSIKNIPPGIVVRNHATQGLFFSVATIIALTNFKSTNQPKWLKIAFLASIPLFITNIIVISTGRSGYIALTLMMLSFVFLFYKEMPLIKKILISLLCLITLTIFMGVSNTSSQRIEQAKSEFDSGRITPEYTSVGLRLIFWENTIAMAPNYLLIGTGVGGFEKAYATQVQGKPGNAGIITGDPHNQYLKILIEHGVIGLAVFLSVIILLIKQHIKNTFRTIGISAIIAISTTSLFNSHFSTFNEGLFIWILAGALFATEKVIRK